MRRREPGYYVAVTFHVPGLPALSRDLLDGPWPTRELAERRARDIQEGAEGRAAWRIVRVAEDGVTMVEDAGG